MNIVAHHSPVMRPFSGVQIAVMVGGEKTYILQIPSLNIRLMQMHLYLNDCIYLRHKYIETNFM